MKNINLLLKSNKEILKNVLSNRVSSLEKKEIINSLSQSDTPDITDISHRQILIKHLFDQNISFETLKILLTKIQNLKTSWENIEFLRSVKRMEKMSINKMNLLIDFYESNKFNDGKINEQIYSYLIINNECCGSSTVINRNVLLENLFNRFIEYKNNNSTSIYDRIRFYEMIARKTNNPLIIKNIFNEVMKECKSSNSQIQKDAFRLRSDLLSILFENKNSPVFVVNHCIRLIKKATLLRNCQNKNLKHESQRKFYSSFNKKSFYLLLNKIGKYDFKILFRLNNYQEILTASSRITNLPKSIQNLYQREFEYNLKLSRNKINIKND